MPEEQRDKKRYYRCTACNKYSRFEDENGQDLTIFHGDTFGSPNTVYTGEKEDLGVKGFISFAAGITLPGIAPAYEQRRLVCVHCKKDTLESLYSAEVPKHLLVQRRNKYIHCKKCGHDTRWRARFKQLCEKCGANNWTETYKLEMLKNE